MTTQIFSLFAFLSFFISQTAVSAITVLPSLKVTVPMQTQTTYYTCGPASSMSVLRYFGKGKGNSEMGLARLMDTSTATGTRFWNLANVLNNRGLKAVVKKGATVTDLRNALKLNQPVIMNIDDEGGHYVVLAGVDSKYIYFMDPWYDFTTYRKWGIQKFYNHWYDYHNGTRYNRLGIFVSKRL